MTKFYSSVLLFACIFFLNKAFSQALYPVSLNEKISNAAAILEGRVVEQRSFWNPAHTMIYTANTVEVYKSFKGSVREARVEIMTTGGTVGMENVHASDLLTLDRGETGIFFCSPNTAKLRSPFTGNLLYDVYASGQGCLSYDLAQRTASAPFARYASIQNELYRELVKQTGRAPVIINPSFDIAAQAKPVTPLAPVISSFAPQLVNAGATLDPATNLLVINGSGFGNAPSDSAAILFDDSNDGSGGTPFQVLFNSPLVQSWTDAQIQVKVPDRAGSGFFQVRDAAGAIVTSPAPITVNYSVITRQFSSGDITVIREVNLMNDNGTGGYTILYSTATGGGGVNIDLAPEKATFQRALNTWKETVGFNVTEGGTTGIQAVASDGANVVLFDNNNTGNPPLSAGVLAVCYSYSNMCQPVATNQVQKTEFDIVIRNTGVSTGTVNFTGGPCAPASPYNQIDLETVLLHELGHAINLAHVNDGSEGPQPPNRNPTKLMNYAIEFGVGRRSLDYAAYTGALYCVRPQPGNVYGSCSLANTEMIPLPASVTPLDECPVTFPTQATAPGTVVTFDLVHATSNKFSDPAYNGINCANTGTSVTNNAYYAIRSDADGGSLNMLVSGYASFPSTVQGSCTGAGVRLALYQVNSCPAGQEFPSPIACRTITRNGAVQVINGLSANTNYLIYVDGLDNTKATFNLTLNGTVLPLTLLDFSGTLVNNKVELSWKTANEVNTKEFVVEKSVDGSSFQSFTVVASNGTGAGAIYGATDDQPYSSVSFYRLQMVDRNGATHYSPVVRINTPNKPIVVSRVYPNPTTGKINFDVISDSRKAVSVIATDLLGKKVVAYQLVVDPGTNKRAVSIEGLAAGTYFIQVKDASGNLLQQSKMIKK